MTKKPVQVRIYRRRNRLKDKASGVGGGGAQTPPTFDAEALAKAQAEFAKMAEDYPDWVGGYIGSLQKEFEAVKPKPVESRHPNFSRFNQLAHELKGQGGTFGYPLISIFGKSLFDATGTTAGMSDSHLEIIKAHIDAMQAVISGRVSGDGGAVGAELIKTLEQAIEKYSKNLK